MSAIKPHGGNTGWLFWIVCLIAAVSLLSNVYLLASDPDKPVLKQEAVPAPSTTNYSNKASASTINASTIAELQARLLSLAEGVARNNEQLELLVSEFAAGKGPEMLAKQAERREQAKRASDARNLYLQERQFLHLEENERAVALHERWMAENGEALKLTEAQVLEVERSGIEALERYNARNGISKD